VSKVVDLPAVVARGREFERELSDLKRQLGPAGFWYPYSTLGNLVHLEALLTGEHRQLDAVLGDGVVADIGGADGDLAFFLEQLGYRVHLIDNPPTNFNGLRGARMLKDALSSSVEIFEVDLDSQFTLPQARYETVLFLGIAYHLKNPYYAFEHLARSARRCLVSTRVIRFDPSKETHLRHLPVAYLVDPLETNNDPTNYWMFSETGLRRLLSRAGWDVLDFITVGNTEDSEPATAEGDERAFCLLQSTRA
jgi:tRNA (mo5U34)-methyltransferase